MAGTFAACEEVEATAGSSGAASDAAAEPADDTAKKDKKEKKGKDAAGGDGSVSLGGKSEIRIDGKKFDGIDLETVACTEQDGQVVVSSASLGGQEALGIIMSAGARPKVETLSIVVDGVSLAVSSAGGVSVGSARVEMDGDRYTITGEAVGADTKNLSAGTITRDFEIAVTCS